MSLDTQSLARILGHDFKDTARLTRALTHASTGDHDYERLEFLGDRIVNMLVAEILYARYPDETEGDMARRHTALVRGETLADAARRIGLSAHVILSESEAGSGGHNNDHILCDIMESVTAALYLDGGLEVARSFIHKALTDPIETMAAPPMDPKTALQEWSQAKAIGLPSYIETAREGPDHAPVFTVEVTLPGYAPQTGQGASKRIAEKEAAEKLLERVKE